MKNIFLYFIGLLLISCQLNNAKKEEVGKAVVKQYDCDCKWQKIDTIFPNGDYIKSVLVDSFCEVQIQIKNHRTTLPKKYECPLNEELPKLYYNENNVIEFFRAYSGGSNYITICELIMDSIIINFDFYSSFNYLKDGSSYRVFVFKKPSDKTRVYCKGLFSNTDPAKGFLENNKEERSFKLPQTYWEEEIEVTELHPKYLLIKFKSGKELKIDCNL